MRFYEARVTLGAPRDNSPILAHSVSDLAPMVFEKPRVNRLAVAGGRVHAMPEVDRWPGHSFPPEIVRDPPPPRPSPPRAARSSPAPLRSVRIPLSGK